MDRDADEGLGLPPWFAAWLLVAGAALLVPDATVIRWVVRPALEALEVGPLDEPVHADLMQDLAVMLRVGVLAVAVVSLAIRGLTMAVREGRAGMR